MPNIFQRFYRAECKGRFLRQYILKKKLRRMTVSAIYKHEGLSLLLDSQSVVDHQILIGAGWEPRQINVIKSVLQRNQDLQPVFLDIGSYWGLYSLTAAQLGIREVYAFEADRKNFLQLQTQMFLNSNLFITARNVAVSDKSGTLNFIHSESIPDNRGATRTGTMESATQIVECAAIDSFFDFKDRLIVGKIDVEGHETAVLRGMIGLIARNRIFLQIEQFPENASAVRETAETLGLRALGHLDVDCYYTNLPESEIRWVRRFLD